jgi:hypothetical protein
MVGAARRETGFTGASVADGIDLDSARPRWQGPAL